MRGISSMQLIILEQLSLKVFFIIMSCYYASEITLTIELIVSTPSHRYKPSKKIVKAWHSLPKETGCLAVVYMLCDCLSVSFSFFCCSVLISLWHYYFFPVAVCSRYVFVCFSPCLSVCLFVCVCLRAMLPEIKLLIDWLFTLSVSRISEDLETKKIKLQM